MIVRYRATVIWLTVGVGFVVASNVLRFLGCDWIPA